MKHVIWRILQKRLRFLRRPGLPVAMVTAVALAGIGAESAVAQFPGRLYEDNITAEELTDNPAALEGRTITIRGDVVEQIGESMFAVQDNGWLGGESILVVNGTGQYFTLPSSYTTDVQITGTVRYPFSTDLALEYGLTPDYEAYSAYANTPVLIAESMALSPTPGELVETPELFYGQIVAVEGEVNTRYRDNLFSLANNRLATFDDLLAVGDSLSPTNVGERVVVTGLVVPFNELDWERDYDLVNDLGLLTELEANYDDRAVLLVDEIYPTE